MFMSTLRQPRRMLKSMLACCKIYISESRNSAALESVEQAVKLYPEVVVVNKFKDDAYNRVGYTLVSDFAANPSLDAAPLRKAVFDMVDTAFMKINLESHGGTHPRLGVIDHICFHPLAQASLEQTAKIARTVAAEIGDQLQVPTFCYGMAHHERRTLDCIRRDLGYFKPNSSGSQWLGVLPFQNLHLKPDAGPAQVPQSKGVMIVGATPWVDNYNVPIWSTDVVTVRRIAKKVSGRGGGLESVQAMALIHGEDSIEVACNLLEPEKVSAQRVQLEVERHAAEERLTVGNRKKATIIQFAICVASFQQLMHKASIKEENKCYIPIGA